MRKEALLTKGCFRQRASQNDEEEETKNTNNERHYYVSQTASEAGCLLMLKR